MRSRNQRSQGLIHVQSKIVFLQTSCPDFLDWKASCTEESAASYSVHSRFSPFDSDGLLVIHPQTEGFRSTVRSP